MDMTTEQYYAWSDAYRIRMADDLARQLEAGFWTAHWGSCAKHKKSLKYLLSKIYKGLRESKKVKTVDMHKVAKQFKQFEEIQKHGWTKIE